MTAQDTMQPTVDVTGEGIVRVVPDEVTIRVRVENNGKNPKELKQENDRVVNDVLKFIKGMGIDDKEVTTDFIRLSKNYDYNSKTYNYVANQAISIKVKDLKKYEGLMNGLLESGINRIDGVAFSSSKHKLLESEGRQKAMINAKSKAQEYANAINQTIGKAVSISEFRQSNNGPQPMLKSMSLDSASSGEMQTLAPGEMEIRVTVNVRFALN